jgi:hypothetical protein
MDLTYAPKVRQNTIKTALIYETDRKVSTNRLNEKLTVNYVKPASLVSNSSFKA